MWSLGVVFPVAASDWPPPFQLLHLASSPPPSEQDVWSLGVVLFAAVAGFLPFHSSTGDKKELCNKIIEGR